MAAATSTRFTIIWLDSGINNSEENITAQQKLDHTFDNFKAFEDENVCQQAMESKTEQPILLIISGRLSRLVIPNIDRLEHILGIYIYCMDKSRHEEWAKEFDKIKGIIVELDPLINQIKSDIITLSKKIAATKKPDPTSATSSASSSPKSTVKTNHETTSIPQASGVVAGSNTKKPCALDGYEKEPVVSLEDAVAPLSDIVTDVTQMVWIVKQNCQNPEEGLSIDESASIALYTMEWYPIEGSFFYLLNEALRSEDKKQVKPWFRYLKIVFRALSKLDTISRVVYQGFNRDMSSNYPKGKVFTTWELFKCTSSIRTLEDDESFGKTGQRTLLNIQCRSGKDISRHAFDQSKEEVLFVPGRQFQVVSCLNTGDQLNIVQIEEMKSPYSFE